MTQAQQDELVLKHLCQVKWIAAGIFRKIKQRIPFDDLMQYGSIGLISAARSYDESLGWKFTTYAEHRIRGAIIDGIRKETKHRCNLEVTPQLVPLECASNMADPKQDGVMQKRLLVMDAMKLMSKKQQAVMTATYLEDLGQTRAGEKLGYHQRNVSTIIRETRERVLKATA